MKRKKISIIGLGFVGSAMSVASAMSKSRNGYNFDVTCIDKNNLYGKNKIKNFNQGKYNFNCDDNNLLKTYKKHIFKIKNLRASNDLEVIGNSEIIIISIDCDITNSKNAKKKLEIFIKSSQRIFTKINENSLVLFETTLPPGTIEKLILPIAKRIFKKKGYKKEPSIAYSYERVMPGENYLNSIVNMGRIYSANNYSAKKLCKDFLKLIINTKKFPLREYKSTTEVELSKIIENSYRAINIAIISDWLKFSIKNNLDLNKILDGIRIRPTHDNIRYTGLGAGGYCLTKDPIFTQISSKYIFNQNVNFIFSELAVKKRVEMNSLSFNFIKKIIDKKIRKKDKICIFGLSYKNNIGDLRFSSANEIAHKLKRKYKNVFFQDNFIKTKNNLKLLNIKEINKFKILIFLVNHNYLKNLSFKKIKNKLVIDLGHVMQMKQIKEIKKYNEFFKLGS